MKTVIFFGIAFILGCDGGKDPLSQIFNLCDEVIVFKRPITPDPSISENFSFIHDSLFQRLSMISIINSMDSITWNIKLKKTRISVSANDYLNTEDVIFSIKKNEMNLNKLVSWSQIYSHLYKFNNQEFQISFNRKVNFIKIASSPAFYIYSKNYSSFDIPIGTGTFQVMMKPATNEYVIIPFTKFLHTHSNRIKTIYWLNSSIEIIQNRQVNYIIPSLNKFKEISNAH